MPSVNFVRDEVRDLDRRFTLVEQTLEGQERVKKEKTNLLPMPNAADQSPENLARYELYLMRAIFYNVVKRTLLGLVGLVFSDEPAVSIPDDLEILLEDADGGGVKLEQQARKSLSTVLAFGRAGILTDFPRTRNEDGTSREVTLQERDALRLFPTILHYDHRAIINWRHTRVGSRNLLSLVVLKEQFIKEDDGFRQVMEDQFRVLRLNDQGNYEYEIYSDDQFVTPREGPFTPLDANGQPFRQIPFSFIGAENNEPEPDDPVLYDMAVLNIAHYRNSADYEEMSFIAGQPTTWISGLTENWVKNVMKGEITLGARGVILLPVDGQAGLLQIEQNTITKEAMEQKESQMLALGAQLVESAKIERTATDASNEFEANTSVVGTAANNVTAAYESALGFAAMFNGSVAVDDEGNEQDIVFKLNTEFGLDKLSADQQRQLIESWQKGALTFSEMREKLRESNIASLKDEDARAELEADTIRNQGMGLDEDGEIIIPPENNDNDDDDEGDE